MKTQSNVRPQLLEKYADIWRICYDVTESTLEDGSVMYDYDMIEIPAGKHTRSSLISLLISARYDTDAQIALLANDSNSNEHASEFVNFQAYRCKCKDVATQIMSIE